MSERGSLEIHPTVVRKVVARAVGLVPGTMPGAAVKVGGDGNDLDLAVKLALHYPGPVRAAVAEVRRTVTDEVQRITGYRVRAVAVTVAALRPEPRPRVE